MYATASDISCGVGQLYDMSEVSLEDCVESILDYEGQDDTTKGFYMWSNITRRKNGEKVTNTGGHKLAELIVDAGLGEVTVSCSAVNPNTENEICIWIWRVNRDALNKYADNHGL